MSSPHRDLVFISYSQKDKRWLEELKLFLKPALRGSGITIWDDSLICPGSVWRTEIDNALRRARVVVLLMSQNFQSSDFIADNELPVVLEAAAQGGLLILTVPVSPTDFIENLPEVARYQPAHMGPPLSTLTKARRDAAWVEIARAIVEAYKRTPAHAPPGPWTPDERNGVKKGDAPVSPPAPAPEPLRVPKPLPPEGIPPEPVQLDLLLEAVMELVPLVADIEEYLTRVGIKIARIDMSGGANRVWMRVLSEAVKQHVLRALVAALQRNFPRDTSLQGFLAPY